jgi:hypothetical protein
VDGVTQTIVGLSGTAVRLASHEGEPSVIQLAHLLGTPGFEIIDQAGRPARPLSAAAMAGVPAHAAEEALRWEQHIVEVLTGTRLDAPDGASPRAGFDPAQHPLGKREEAKAAELTALGETVTARTVKRKRQRYQARGLAGLVDWRSDRSRPVAGRTDERIVAALRKAIAEQESGSTRSAGYYLWRTRADPGR